jgi:hypothetical protein
VIESETDMSKRRAREKKNPQGQWLLSETHHTLITIIINGKKAIVLCRLCGEKKEEVGVFLCVL